MFAITFSGEHEHTVMISVSSRAGEFHEPHHFYSINEDLASLRPYKGNIHTHSTLSDGLVSPLEAACIMRRSGFDFFALTDHNLYQKSFPILEKYESGFEWYAGEEASSIPGVNHVLSLGTPSSITEWQGAPDSDYQNRVSDLEQTPLFASLPSHERNLAAQTETLFRKIHELGGVSVFCHPYWFCESRYYSTPEENDFLLRNGSFDALEIGNHHVGRMALLNAKIRELSEECGFDKPLVGSSDWHGRVGQSSETDYTIVFAESPCFDDFAKALRSGRCVAVGGCKDEFAFGSFRLVKYANFLAAHFFRPLHDPLCRQQGEILLSRIKTNVEENVDIIRLKKEIKTLYRTFFMTA